MLKFWEKKKVYPGSESVREENSYRIALSLKLDKILQRLKTISKQAYIFILIDSKIDRLTIFYKWWKLTILDDKNRDVNNKISKKIYIL